MKDTLHRSIAGKYVSLKYGDSDKDHHGNQLCSGCVFSTNSDYCEEAMNERVVIGRMSYSACEANEAVWRETKVESEKSPRRKLI